MMILKKRPRILSPIDTLSKKQMDDAFDRVEASDITLSLTRQEAPSNMYNAEERAEQIKKMHEVYEQFYWLATTTHVHAFIEFTGLMAKFVDVCRKAHEAGLDYNICNTHTGQALPKVEAHDVEYMAEKLECIFGPTLQKPEIRKAFLTALFPDSDIEIRRRKRVVRSSE